MTRLFIHTDISSFVWKNFQLQRFAAINIFVFLEQVFKKKIFTTKSSIPLKCDFYVMNCIVDNSARAKINFNKISTARVRLLSKRDYSPSGALRWTSKLTDCTSSITSVLFNVIQNYTLLLPRVPILIFFLENFCAKKLCEKL